MTRISLVALAGLAFAALLAAACGGGGGSPTASPEPSPALTMVASPTARVALPTPLARPVAVAGMTLYPYDAWRGRSTCPEPVIRRALLGPRGLQHR
jgi:hypothetical protein